MSNQPPPPSTKDDGATFTRWLGRFCKRIANHKLHWLLSGIIVLLIGELLILPAIIGGRKERSLYQDTDKHLRSLESSIAFTIKQYDSRASISDQKHRVENEFILNPDLSRREENAHILRMLKNNGYPDIGSMSQDLEVAYSDAHDHVETKKYRYATEVLRPVIEKLMDIQEGIEEVESLRVFRDEARRSINAVNYKISTDAEQFRQHMKHIGQDWDNQLDLLLNGYYAESAKAFDNLGPGDTARSQRNQAFSEFVRLHQDARSLNDQVRLAFTEYQQAHETIDNSRDKAARELSRIKNGIWNLSSTSTDLAILVEQNSKPRLDRFELQIEDIKTAEQRAQTLAQLALINDGISENLIPSMEDFFEAQRQWFDELQTNSKSARDIGHQASSLLARWERAKLDWAIEYDQIWDQLKPSFEPDLSHAQEASSSAKQHFVKQNFRDAKRSYEQTLQLLGPDDSGEDLLVRTSKTLSTISQVLNTHDLIHNLAVSGEMDSRVGDESHLKLATILEKVGQIDQSTKRDIVNSLDSDQRTPLYAAAAEGRDDLTTAKVIELLLANDANPNIHSVPNERHPIHIAAQRGFVKTLNSLLASVRINGNETDKFYYTTLHHAVASDQAETVEFLLQHPKSRGLINDQTQAGDTPLHIAVRIKNARIKNILLQHGADASIVNIEGDRAIP